MLRQKRLELLTKYVNDINIDVADLPKNEDRFWVEAEMDDRGYRVVFTVSDRKTGDYYLFTERWLPMKTRFGYYYPMDVFMRINQFVIDRRDY